WDAAPPTFEVRLSGAVSRRIVEGEVRLSLITAPSGEILLDSTETLRREDTWLQVDPLPALGFPGLAAAVPGGDPAALLAERTAEAFLLGIARGLVKELEVQISRWERGLTDDANREQLVELVYLHAPALAAARQARPRYEELLRLLASTPADAAPVSLELAYDPARGAGEQGVSLTVLPAPPRAALEDERLRLETLHQTCWTLEPRLATILRDLLGTDLDEVLRHRGTLDRLMAR
ncbi:MAG: hypothetical protein FJ098_14845, partial [Deltaproteobacteria bacterium]|nr:hypothetical protein [Deltaproteobacteria bacterium]